jgi:hypothetical protein
MDSLVKKVKELLEDSDPDITVTEDPHPTEPNGEDVAEPPLDSAIV